MKKTLFIRLLLGIVCGAAAAVLIRMIVGGAAAEAKSFVADLAGGVIFGAVIAAGSLVFEIESWSLGRAMLIHFLILGVAAFSVNAVLAWVEPALCLFIIAGMALAYILAWVILSFFYRRRISDINGMLKDLRS